MARDREAGAGWRIASGVRSHASAWAAVTAAICCGAVALAVPVGLRLPTTAQLDYLPSEASLDYAASLDTGVAPLRRDFVRGVLGLSGNEAAAAAISAAPRSRRASPGAEAIQDIHPFTNDDRQNAFLIRALPFSGTTDARAATRESDEPRDCGGTGGTAWYAFAPADDTTLIATTVGTDHAVSLGVFAPGADGSLEPIACDTGITRAAFAEFGAAAGQRYLFQLTATAASGRLTFNLESSGSTELVYSGTADDPSSLAAPGARPSLSADGRFVAFTAYATNLTPDTPAEPCHTRSGFVPGSAEDASNSDHGVPCRHAFVRDLATGETTLLSTRPDGEPGNLEDYSAFIAGDGRYVAFTSTSDNLVAGDTNEATDVFVRDLHTGGIERVSVSSSGDQAAGDPLRTEDTVGSIAVSDDGRYIAFVSVATNLVAQDTNGVADVFVRDRVAGRTERISLTPQRTQTSTASLSPTISSDGRFVSFAAANGEGVRQTYLHDRTSGTVEIVSVSSAGKPADGPSADFAPPSISTDGRFVVFTSEASNLADDDRNGSSDIFVRDRVERTTALVSRSSTGEPAEDGSYDANISRDGRYVAFTSRSANLAGGSRQGGQTVEDLFVRDLVAGTTARMAVAPHGRTMDGAIRFPFMSRDSRRIVFAAVCLDVCAPRVSQFEIWLHDRTGAGSR